MTAFEADPSNVRTRVGSHYCAGGQKNNGVSPHGVLELVPCARMWGRHCVDHTSNNRVTAFGKAIDFNSATPTERIERVQSRSRQAP